MDRVQLIKSESAALGGDGADEKPYDHPIEPQEDAIEVAGVYFQDASNRDENVCQWRVGDDMMFKDVNNPAGKSLSQIAQATGMTELKDDTSPELGGNLDIGSYKVLSGSYDLLYCSAGSLFLGDSTNEPIDSRYNCDSAHNFYLDGTMVFRVFGKEDPKVKLYNGADLDMNSHDIENVNTVDGRSVSTDGSTLDAHVASTSNPHSVTAAQVGALTELSEDASPELGGDLNVGSNKIVSGSYNLLYCSAGSLFLGDSANEPIDSRYNCDSAHNFYLDGTMVFRVWGKADPKVQLYNGADLDMNGHDIENPGTVDGRTIATDGSTLDAHVASTSNPHSVTAAQVGAITQLADDTSPALGGNIEIGTYKFTFASGARYALYCDADELFLGGTEGDGAAQPERIRYCADDYHRFYIDTSEVVRFGTGLVDFFGCTLDLNTNGIRGVEWFRFVSVVDQGTKSADFEIDFADGQHQEVTLGASVAITSLSFPTGSGRYQLTVRQDATGGRVLTHPAGVLAPGGKAVGLVNSTAANAVDVIEYYYDGATAYARFVGKDYKA